MEDRINDSILRRILGEDDSSSPVCNVGGQEGGCTAGSEKWGLKGYPLAMVYSTINEFEDIKDLDNALLSGTIFNSLDLPFMGRSVTKGGKCRG